MRRPAVSTIINRAPLAIVVCILAVASVSPAQDHPGVAENKSAGKQNKDTSPKTLSLDEEMARALRDNPDIRVAEAKVRDAQAELNRVRLQVAHKVTVGHRALETQRKSLASAEHAFQYAAGRMKQGTIPPPEMDAADEALAKARGKLAELQAEIDYLLGQPVEPREKRTVAQIERGGAVFAVDLSSNALQQGIAARHFEEALQMWDASRLAAGSNASLPRASQGPGIEKVRKDLEAVSPGFKFEGTLAQALNEIQGTSSITFVRGAALPDVRVDLRLDSQPWGQVLQALEDIVPKLCFVPRQYGILVTTEDFLPPGAVRLQAFLKAPAADKPAPSGKK